MQVKERFVISKYVYVAMSGDIIHHGQINIIREAAKLGDVIIGLHTDEVIASYWRLPILSYAEREAVVSNIKGVMDVIPQYSLDQSENLLKIRPNFVVHGDDWIDGPQRYLRDKVIEVLKQWNGKLIEVKRTDGVNLNQLDQVIQKLGTTSDYRRSLFKKMLAVKKKIRILEAHNGLTGLIVEKTKLFDKGIKREFDAMWISSLCDSTVRGKPDIELVDITSKLNVINEILEVTTKPIIVDGDTGGKIEHFTYTIRSLERVGVSGIIIEDKIGLKKNSLFGTQAQQIQDSIEDFCKKISAGKNIQVTKDFMIFARIESLILAKGMQDAIDRAKAYIKAGADGIMIHSIDQTGKEIFEFCKKYNLIEERVPLIVVPTAYNQIYEDDLYNAGVNIVIYANHLLRSAYKSMNQVAYSILQNGRSKDCEQMCIGINEILNLIDID